MRIDNFTKILNFKKRKEEERNSTFQESNLNNLVK